MLDGRALDCKPKVDVCLRVGSIPASGILLREYVVIGNRSVSKTEAPGSNPGTPAKVRGYSEAWRNWLSHWSAKPGSYPSLVWVRFPPPLPSYFKLWRVSLIGKAVVSKTTVGLYL